MIDTAKVQDHRKLRFDRIPDLLAEIDRIVEADEAGRLKCSGNWSAGQAMGHVAAWIEYGYVGYPMKPPPWFIRFILRIAGKKYIRKGMPMGVKIPGVPEGTFGVEPMTTRDGADRLRKAAKRLEFGEATSYDSPAFGPMSFEDRIQLNLRHAELHLGYLHP